jgi:hypothetical protein
MQFAASVEFTFVDDREEAKSHETAYFAVEHSLSVDELTYINRDQLSRVRNESGQVDRFLRSLVGGAPRMRASRWINIRK